MRKLSIVLAASAALMLSGCVLVPVDSGYGYYDSSPAYVSPGVVVGPYYGSRHYGRGYWRGGHRHWR